MTTIIFNSDLEALATKISYSVGETDVYITNGNLSKITRNFTTGQVEGVVVGIPAISATSTRFKGPINYMNTQIDETATMTIFTICKRPVGDTTDDAMVISNNGTVNGDNGIGSSIWLKGNGNYAFATARDNGSGGQTGATGEFAVATPTNWNLLVASCDTNLTTLTCPTTNQTANSSNVNARFVKSAKMRIGASYTAVHTGGVDVMVTVVVPRVLSVNETAQVVAQLRAYALKHSVVV